MALDPRFEHITDVLEQLSKDLELASVNIQRLIKTQNRKPSPESGARSWDPSKIKWTNDVGKKGPYEKADSGTEDYQKMLKDLQEHQGKLNHEGRFYWLFQDNKTVGRTLSK